MVETRKERKKFESFHAPPPDPLVNITKMEIGGEGLEQDGAAEIFSSSFFFAVYEALVVYL